MEDRLSRAFAALADPIRRDIVARLAIGDATVGELAAPHSVSLQAISKHLKVLEAAGLVTKSREAQRRPVHLEAAALAELTDWIHHYHRLAEADGQVNDFTTQSRMSRLESALAALSEEASAPDESRPTTPQGETP